MAHQRMAAAALLCLLTACSTQIDLSVPISKEKEFADCVVNPALSWQSASASALRTSSKFIAAVVMAQNAELRRAQPLTTTPPKSFRNFYAEALVGTPLSPATQASVEAANQAVGRVQAILTHPVQKNIIDMYNGLSGTATLQPIRFDVRELNDYVSKVAQSTSLDDWTPYTNLTVWNFGRTNSPLTSDAFTSADVQELFSHMVITIYIETYLKAYFRNGKFIQGKVTLDTLTTEVPALRRLQEPYRTQLQKILNSLKDQLSFGKIATTGFVTRGGDTLQFPDLNISLDVAKVKISATKLDYLTIGSDLIRVLLEAVFDSYDRLPAVTNATGVSVTSSRSAGPIQLPDFSKIKPRPPYTQVSKEQFGSIETFANGVDASSGTATGQLLRGIGWAALNNEAVAKLIESAVGTSVRKVGEKLAWCWYATAPLPPPAIASLPGASIPPDVRAALIPARINAAPIGDTRQITVTVGY